MGPKQKKINILRSIFCFFGVHDEVFTHVTPYIDTSYGQRAKSISYVKVCRNCGKHKTGDIYGCYALSADELNLSKNNKNPGFNVSLN